MIDKTLEARGLTKLFSSRKVVDNVCLYAKQGEIVGLLGPNGAGKTTIFKIMTGLVRPDSGRIFLDSRDIADEPIFKRARRGLGYLPQESSVFKKMSVEDNLMAIFETLQISNSEMMNRLNELIEEFELSALRGQRAETLSGGEKRRLEIARALVPSPLFILLDEPFAGIDPKSVAGIQDILLNLKKRDIGVIITDHNVRETLFITDRSYIIFEGRVLIEGASSKLVEDEMAKEVYLGERFKM